MTINERLAALVVEAAAHLGSQSKLARFLGVSRQAVNEWKQGKAVPGAENVVRMQDLLRRAACIVGAVILSILTSPQDANAALNINNSDATFATTMLIVFKRLRTTLFHWLKRNSYAFVA